MQIRQCTTQIISLKNIRIAQKPIIFLFAPKIPVLSVVQFDFLLVFAQQGSPSGLRSGGDRLLEYLKTTKLPQTSILPLLDRWRICLDGNKLKRESSIPFEDLLDHAFPIFHHALDGCGPEPRGWTVSVSVIEFGPDQNGTQLGHVDDFDALCETGYQS